MAQVAQEGTFAVLVQESSPLLSLWCDFYTRLALSVAQHAHKTLPTCAAVDTLCSAQNAPQFLPHVGTWAQLPSAWQFQDMPPVQRLTLLPQDILHRICLLCAVAVHYKPLCRLVLRQDILRLQELVGQDGWYFALRRAALYKADVLEENFTGAEDIFARISSTAAIVLDFCVQHVPESLSAHVYFVLSACARQDCPPLSAAHKSQLEAVLCRLARQEVEMPWNTLF